MLFLKFSIIFLSLNAFSFSGSECFNTDLDVSVSHKSFPFGLLEKTLTISKKNCEVTISHNELKYRNRKWIIDTCREPVHLKIDSGSVDVLRKANDCKTTSDDFCNEYATIKKIIQDDGLIFADGDKTSLTSSHGKVFCNYVLIDQYLGNDLVMTSGFDYDYLFKDKKKIIEDEDNTLSIDPNSDVTDF